VTAKDTCEELDQLKRDVVSAFLEAKRLRLVAGRINSGRCATEPWGVQKRGRQKQEVLDKTSQDLASANNDVDREALRTNVEISKADLELKKDDLKELQARQAELKSKAAAASASADATPPTQ